MQKKNQIQESLFDLIRKNIPAHINLAEKVAEVLTIGIDPVYRRIRGENLLTLEEAEKLCKYFGLSFDALLYGTEKMQYSLVPSDIREIKSYVAYAKELSSITENFSPTSKSEVRIIAADIPAFHYAAYKELSLFNLFSWDKNIYDYPESFEDFLKRLGDPVTQYNEKIFLNFQNTPSTEIWTDNTIDSTLKLIKYHFEMEHFCDKQTPVTICEQILDLVYTLQEWIKKGAKGANNTPFKFYINEIDIGNTLILIKNEAQSRCVVRLFTINGLNIKDDMFCNEVENWFDNLIKRSTLISSVSTTERFKFLTSQKQKINTLIDYIKSF